MRGGAAFCIVGTIGAKVGTPKPSPPGKGDRHRRWMRGGTTFCIVGTVGAEVETQYVYNLQRFYEFAVCFCNVSRSPAPSSVRAAPCQLPRRGSFCTGLWGGEFIGTPLESSQYLPQRGRGTARRRWMRGGTALNIVGTMGAEAETFLRIRPLFFECFRSPRPSSVRAAPCQLPRRGSFCTGLWGGGVIVPEFLLQNPLFLVFFAEYPDKRL